MAEARRIAGASGRVNQADLPLVLESAQAEAIAETWLFETWAARERASFALPPSLLGVEPADIVRIADDADGRLFRVTEIGEHGARDIEARGVDPDVYGGSSRTERPTRPDAPVITGQPLVEFIDLPLLRGDEPPAAGYAAATQAPWPGSVAVYGSPETTGYALESTGDGAGNGRRDARRPAGACLGPHRSRHATDGEDRRAKRSARARCCNSWPARNVAVVRNSDGEWEVIQFQTATSLRRGLTSSPVCCAGRAAANSPCAPLMAAGARFVLINTAVARVDLAASEIRLPYSWRYGPATRDIGDASYAVAAHTFQGLGLKPLSPVHVRASRAGGDVDGRLDPAHTHRRRQLGDAGGAAERRLRELRGRCARRRRRGADADGERAERRLHGGRQAADFGSAQPAYDIRVYQMSASYGRGTPRAASV